MQAQTWRLAASVSPDKKPTRTIAARVARMVKDVISGDAKKNGHAKDAEPIFDLGQNASISSVTAREPKPVSTIEITLGEIL